MLLYLSKILLHFVAIITFASPVMMIVLVNCSGNERWSCSALLTISRVTLPLYQTYRTKFYQNAPASHYHSQPFELPHLPFLSWKATASACRYFKDEGWRIKRLISLRGIRDDIDITKDIFLDYHWSILRLRWWSYDRIVRACPNQAFSVYSAALYHSDVRHASLLLSFVVRAAYRYRYKTQAIAIKDDWEVNVSYRYFFTSFRKCQ